MIRARASIVAAALAAIAGWALASPPAEAAQAGPAQGGAARTTEAGELVLELGKDARRKLRRAGVELGAKAPGRVRGGRLKLPVTGGETAATAQMRIGGQVRFAKGRKTVRLRRLKAVVGGDGSFVTGRLDGTQYTLFQLSGGGAEPFDPLTGAVRLDRARARMAGLIRGVLADALGAERLPRRLGTASLAAELTPVPGEQTEATVRPRPAGAEEITSAEISWRARESWVDYLHDAPDGKGGATAIAPAVDGSAETVPPSPQARVYEFELPFAGGWFDGANGAANVETAGGVNFFKLIDPFQIDLDAIDAVVELGGARPRMLATLNGRRNNADQQERRAVIVDLDPSVAPTVTEDGLLGTRYVYGPIPASVPTGSDTWPIAGFYAPATQWGSITVSFTVGGV